MPADENTVLRVALETRMGELASLLTEVAEALASYPGDLVIRDDITGEEYAAPHGDTILVNAREWPSIQEIEQLLTNWRTLRDLPGVLPSRTESAPRSQRR